jgi:phage terminase large subunit-like protein
MEAIPATTSKISRKPELLEKYWYDKRAATRAVKFIEKFCVHIEDGIQTRQFEPVRLEWWQKRILMRFFGWKHVTDDRRKYKTLYIEIPRKNGKTSLCAWILLYLLFADGERGAQIVCAASSSEQSQIVFDICAEIVRHSPRLFQSSRVLAKSIRVLKTRNVLRCVSGRPKGKHGKNLHALVVDELHEQDDRKLVDALSTSNIARRQPVEIYLTTSGDDPNSVCYEKHVYAEKVRDGDVIDDSFLPVLFCADPEKWKDEEEWIKANPNIGIGFELEKMRGDFETACQIPAFENTFKRLRLCIWTEQDHRAIPMDHWKQCYRARSLDTLKKQDCYMGLDLSSNSDVTAGILLFPPIEGARSYYDMIRLFWYPRMNLKDRQKRARDDITPWAQQGFIRLIEGETIDHAVLRRDINEIGKIYRIREIAIDRWNAQNLQNDLDQDGFTVIPFGQGYASMNSPTKMLLGLILKHELNHDRDPVLNWMAANFAVETNAAGDVKPSKKKAREKIDGIVALIMALSRAAVRKATVEKQIQRGGPIVLRA